MAYETKDNRTRNKKISIFLNDKELIKLQHLKEKTSSKTYSQVIRDLLIKGKIENFEVKKENLDNIRNLTQEINAIGKNINQISRMVNSGQPVFQSDIDYMKKEIENIKLKVMDLL